MSRGYPWWRRYLDKKAQQKYARDAWHHYHGTKPQRQYNKKLILISIAAIAVIIVLFVF